MHTLRDCLPVLAEPSALQMAFAQWRRFLNMAYGRFSDSPDLFLVHSYLSVFAKLIAYAVLKKQPIPDDQELRATLDGSLFERLNVARFVEDDFFHWVGMEAYFPLLRPMFRALNQEIAEYDFSDVQEDILKGVYQELIDLDTRHALGEHYTPDWLCERIMAELPLAETTRLLDPACGSGSFLRAAAARLHRDYPALGADDIARQVVGIDIHPLSVQIAKTTLLLALGAAITQCRQPVTLQVYLANSLCTPKGATDLFRPTCKVSVNSEHPAFLKNGFDVVVGNPPWLTYTDIANADYQALLRALADEYGVTPKQRSINMTNLEIAAIFLGHTVNYFLKPAGLLAFVLPRSFFSADQHDNTRSGAVQGVQLTSAWDLKDVEPLFRVPACVLFARRNASPHTLSPIPEQGIPGYVVAGRSPHSPGLADSETGLKWEKTRWHYARLQSGKQSSRSALTRNPNQGLTGQNAYADRFKNGATIIPRSFFFIDLNQDIPPGDYRERVIHVSTAKAILREAKAPWKNLILNGRIEGEYLYRTALAKNIAPFVLINPPLVLLPLSIETLEDSAGVRRHFMLHDHEALHIRGARYASEWFWQAEALWKQHRTENNTDKNTALPDYLNWQHKLTSQNPDARFMVLYTASGTDACAVLIDASQFDAPFIVDHKAYWHETRTLEEGHYLCAYLNSNFANQRIKDFQSRGLFGARDIHKTIVKLPFPFFNPQHPDHQQLAASGQQCAALAMPMIDADPDLDLQPRALGRLRSRLREQLAKPLADIDVLVEKLMLEAA